MEYYWWYRRYRCGSIYSVQRYWTDQRNLKSFAWKSAGSRICQSYYRENPVVSWSHRCAWSDDPRLWSGKFVCHGTCGISGGNTCHWGAWNYGWDWAWFSETGAYDPDHPLRPYCGGKWGSGKNPSFCQSGGQRVWWETFDPWSTSGSGKFVQ